MSSHKYSSEECIGAEQVSHQKYCCTNYNVIKYLYSVNVIQYLFGSNYKFRVRPKLLSWYRSRKIERPRIKCDEAIKERIGGPEQDVW